MLYKKKCGSALPGSNFRGLASVQVQMLKDPIWFEFKDKTNLELLFRSHFCSLLLHILAVLLFVAFHIFLAFYFSRNL